MNLSNQKKRRSKYTEDWLPVQNISNGIVSLDDGNKLTGVKILPRNIFILDEDAQVNVINGLKNFYNTIDYEFWIMVSDRPVDVSIYLSHLQLLYNSVHSQQVRKMINQDIEKANTFMNNNVVDTEYYLMFKEKNPDIIQKRIRQLISGLSSCGLNATPVTNDDIRILLDGFLGGGTTTEFGTVMPI